jgi:hypothetical protein
MAKSSGTKSSRKQRIEDDQRVRPFNFTNNPYAEYKSFQNLIVSLYGPTGIGKTTFAFNIPGLHILATEPVNNPSKFSHTRIPNWPTFKDFLDKMEAKPRLCKDVTMWGIDTIEFLVNKCMSTICYEWGLLDLSDEGFSRAWTELKQELVFNLLRLVDLGPGLLLISHQRQRDSRVNRTIIKADTADLSPSINNAMSFLSSIILHMRYVDKSKTSADLGHLRCFCIRGNEEEDAKDNTGKLGAVAPEGIIKFRSEKQAVRKILSCFK